MKQTAISAWVHALPLPALFISQNRMIVSYNKAAKSIFNEGLEGRNYTNTLRQPTAVDAIETSLIQKCEQNTRIQINTGSGDATFDVHVAHIAQDTPGVLVTMIDRSEGEKTTQVHRDFVANVSHELKTPLTAVAGFIETLQGPAKNDENAHERFLEMMAEETGRMNRLVSDLLSLSRVESQERQRPQQKIALDQLLSTTVTHVAPLAAKHGADIRLEMSADLPVVLGQGDQLRQVFNNLIDNAIRYGGHGVKITIETTVVAQDLRLRCRAIKIAVRDAGPGFDPIHIPRLTERFYRIDGHRSREKGGTGLGLAITKHIIARHQGRLEIKSVPALGSEFTVIIPTA